MLDRPSADAEQHCFKKAAFQKKAHDAAKLKEIHYAEKAGYQLHEHNIVGKGTMQQISHNRSDCGKDDKRTYESEPEIRTFFLIAGKD